MHKRLGIVEVRQEDDGWMLEGLLHLGCERFDVRLLRCTRTR